MITWITENIAIGEYTDACSRKNLLREKIDCILDLRVIEAMGEPILCAQNEIVYFKVPVGRYENIEPIKIELRTAAYMLEQLAEKYKRILVHCTAGMDRSPFVVAYWMANGSNFREGDSGDFRTIEDLKIWIARAYSKIKEKRPQIIEHYEWI